MKIHVKVLPFSKKESIEYIGEDMFGIKAFRVKIAEKPVDGKANDGVIEALSNYFDIPKRLISIESGHISRDKIINIDADITIGK